MRMSRNDPQILNWNADLCMFWRNNSVHVSTWPRIGARDVDLYQLYRAISSEGGLNKVLLDGGFPRIARQLRYSHPEHCPGQLIRICYEKTLFLFEQQALFSQRASQEQIRYVRMVWLKYPRDWTSDTPSDPSEAQAIRELASTAPFNDHRATPVPTHVLSEEAAQTRDVLAPSQLRTVMDQCQTAVACGSLRGQADVTSALDRVEAWLAGGAARAHPSTLRRDVLPDSVDVTIRKGPGRRPKGASKFATIPPIAPVPAVGPHLPADGLTGTAGLGSLGVALLKEAVSWVADASDAPPLSVPPVPPVPTADRHRWVGDTLLRVVRVAGALGTATQAAVVKDTSLIGVLFSLASGISHPAILQQRTPCSVFPPSLPHSLPPSLGEEAVLALIPLAPAPIHLDSLPIDPGVVLKSLLAPPFSLPRVYLLAQLLTSTRNLQALQMGTRPHDMISGLRSVLSQCAPDSLYAQRAYLDCKPGQGDGDGETAPAVPPFHPPGYPPHGSGAPSRLSVPCPPLPLSQRVQAVLSSAGPLREGVGPNRGWVGHTRTGLAHLPVPLHPLASHLALSRLAIQCMHGMCQDNQSRRIGNRDTSSIYASLLATDTVLVERLTRCVDMGTDAMVPTLHSVRHLYLADIHLGPKGGGVGMGGATFIAPVTSTRTKLCYSSPDADLAQLLLPLRQDAALMVVQSLRLCAVDAVLLLGALRRVTALPTKALLLLVSLWEAGEAGKAGAGDAVARAAKVVLEDTQ
ncbi:hypothetical protein KIPB_005513 [Kipferlia bialata]|uniref:ARID domain-containing protein n=2 Tax=Kipferlia bialata TaxID=797122 RepID=A0A9K3CVH6_9EUKA|nr:hypothetical protein KIPB_002074 [Kipferlia bialata]GIQ81656.1 hypothetical protein KIPB_002647 [Kipferlia bialata]GIQ82806.1 hypothetical protein KIPB_004010 [Kipferlia bialata]GIQ84078.1 hypothetical protein KIPB_005513 [Kipferlia bialata]|eukprot:g2074.t1